MKTLSDKKKLIGAFCLSHKIELKYINLEILMKEMRGLAKPKLIKYVESIGKNVGNIEESNPNGWGLPKQSEIKEKTGQFISVDALEEIFNKNNEIMEYNRSVLINWEKEFINNFFNEIIKHPKWLVLIQEFASNTKFTMQGTGSYY